MNEYLKINSNAYTLCCHGFLNVSIKTLRQNNNIYNLSIDALTIEGKRTKETLNITQGKIGNKFIDFDKGILFKLEYGIITNVELREQIIKIKDGNDEDSGGLLAIYVNSKSIKLVDATISFQCENKELFLFCKGKIKANSKHPLIKANSNLDLVAKVTSQKNFNNINERLAYAKKEVAQGNRYRMLVSKLKGEDELVLPNIDGYEELPKNTEPLNREFTDEDSRNCWNLASKLITNK